ncbi:helix-turn-helix domain-containing protein [Leifsonia sp. NPDC058292]|uniref:helix-turn-helix domain-containing protein n=1 Tax=Leifsonia sp. NPDC058292 TaxID=3346428 RepID=UPI0036DA2B4A
MNETRIRELRTTKGWTQERLAENSGVAVRTIQRLESGEDASLETLGLLADALEVAVGDLFASVERPDIADAIERLDVIRAEQKRQAEERQLQRRRTERLITRIILIVVAAVVLIVVAFVGLHWINGAIAHAALGTANLGWGSV